MNKNHRKFYLHPKYKTCNYAYWESTVNIRYVKPIAKSMISQYNFIYDDDKTLDLLNIIKPVLNYDMSNQILTFLNPLIYTRQLVVSYQRGYHFEYEFESFRLAGYGEYSLNDKQNRPWSCKLLYGEKHEISQSKYTIIAECVEQQSSGEALVVHFCDSSYWMFNAREKQDWITRCIIYLSKRIDEFYGLQNYSVKYTNFDQDIQPLIKSRLHTSTDIYTSYYKKNDKGYWKMCQ